MITRVNLFTGASFSVYENIGVIKSAGVEIRDIRSTLVPIRKELQQDFDLESYVFVPFVLDEVRRQLITIVLSVTMCIKSFFFYTFY
jgi:hypothetical protein